MTTDEARGLEERERRLREVENTIEIASPGLAEMKRESASLNRRILSVGGTKLAKSQAKVDSFQNQIEQLSSTLSTKEVEEKNLLKNQDKAKLIIKKSQEEILKLKQKKEDLIKEREEMEKDATEIIDLLEQAQEMEKEIASRLEDSKLKYEEKASKVEKVKAVECDLLVEIERVKKELNEERKGESHWKKQSEDIRRVYRDEMVEFTTMVKTTTEEVMKAYHKDKAATAAATASSGEGMEGATASSSNTANNTATTDDQDQVSLSLSLLYV